MNTVTRLGIALAGLFFLGGLAATFLPTSASTGADCGSWVNPAYDRTEVSKLLDRGNAVAEDSARLGLDTSDLESLGAGLAVTVVQCDDTLGTRRTVAVVLFGLAVIAPAALFFVAGRSDENERPGATV